MTPDHNQSYTPPSSQFSYDDFVDWPSTSAMSEDDFSPLSSEPLSPDLPYGLGLFLPSFEDNEFIYHSQPRWPQQSDVQHASQSIITTSTLPIVKTEYLRNDQLHEKYEAATAWLPGTPQDMLHTTGSENPQIVSPSRSNHSMPSRASPVTSAFVHSGVNHPLAGLPFIFPKKFDAEDPDSGGQRAEMSITSFERAEATRMDSHVPRAIHSRTASSDDIMSYSIGERKKKKFATQENARHSCQVCARLFQRRFNYRKHMETHQPIRLKPFRCEYEGCNTSFARRTDLVRHEKSLHLRKRDYKCPKCSWKFARKDTLIRHVDQGCRKRNILTTRPQRQPADDKRRNLEQIL